MTITDSPVDNGVNVQALLGAREALSAAPEAAAVHLAGQLHLAQRHPQPLHRGRLHRPGRRAAAPHHL